MEIIIAALPTSYYLVRVGVGDSVIGLDNCQWSCTQEVGPSCYNHTPTHTTFPPTPLITKVACSPLLIVFMCFSVGQVKNDNKSLTMKEKPFDG